MSETPTIPDALMTPWTCPFCPLLCDGFAVRPDPASDTLELLGSDCRLAQAALAQFAATPSGARPQVDGRPCDLDSAIATAARWLAASRQPLFGGFGSDVAGARALYRLACETGAISDATQGAALMHGLRTLQDRGAFTTTLAEVRTRADLIVCIGGLPTARQPEFLRRCGVGEPGVAQRHLVALGGPADLDEPSRVLLAGAAGVTLESLPWHGDVFDTVALLALLVAGRTAPGAPASLVALAQRLHAARYAVIVWEGGALPAQGALVVEGINRIVGLLNRTTRAAALQLGGGDGAATANQVFTWLSGLPLRSRVGPLGLEHEPLCFDASRLLGDGAVDALLWVSSFGAHAAPPATQVPRVVLGHPALAADCAQAAQTVFIPVATPGVGSAGHLFRTDGMVLMPLHALRAELLPTVAAVVDRLTLALQALRKESTT